MKRIKQYISFQQWNQLTGDEKKLIRFKIRGVERSEALGSMKIGNQLDYPKFTIGELIEFLGNDLVKIDFNGVDYGVYTDVDGYGGVVSADQLCDALFLAAHGKMIIIIKKEQEELKQ